MPFDNTPPAKTEIDILDEMAATLASPQSWCQKILCTKSNGSSAYCLYGALNLADHGHPSWYSWYNMGGARLRTEAAREVQEMLTNLAAAHTPSHATSSSRKNFIAMFNNSHTHQEVLDLIAEARARMS